MTEKPRNTRGELVSDLWQTPDQGYNLLHETFVFQVDGAAGPENHKCPKWFGPGGVAEDAFLVPKWRKHGTRFFFNPPYSVEGGPLSRWVQEFHVRAVHEGILVVAVLPERRNVKWYHEWVKGKAAIFEPDHRWAFSPPDEETSEGPGARQGTMIVVWGGKLAMEGSWA